MASVGDFSVGTDFCIVSAILVLAMYLSVLEHCCKELKRGQSQMMFLADPQSDVVIKSIMTTIATEHMCSVHHDFKTNMLCTWLAMASV